MLYVLIKRRDQKAPSFRPFIRHLEKQKIRQLLDIIAITHPIVTENVAVVPEFLNELV